MATTLTPTNANIAKIDELSDYGSDIDDATAVELFSQIDSQPLNNTVLESIEQPIIEHEPLEQHINIPLARLRQNFDSAHKSSGTIETTAGRRKPPIEVEYDESNRRSFTRELAAIRKRARVKADGADAPAPHSLQPR